MNPDRFPRLRPYRKIAYQLLRYGVTGGLSVAVYLGFLWIFIHEFSFSNFYANISAYACATAFNYVMNYYWSFASKRTHSGASWRFACVVACGMLFNGVYVAAATSLFGMPVLAAGLSFAILWPFVSFACLKFWTFGTHPGAS